MNRTFILILAVLGLLALTAQSVSVESRLNRAIRGPIAQQSNAAQVAAPTPASVAPASAAPAPDASASVLAGDDTDMTNDNDKSADMGFKSEEESEESTEESSESTEDSEGSESTEDSEGSEESENTEDSEGSENTEDSEGSEASEGSEGSEESEGSEASEASEGTEGTEGIESTTEKVKNEPSTTGPDSKKLTVSDKDKKLESNPADKKADPSEGFNAKATIVHLCKKKTGKKVVPHIETKNPLSPEPVKFKQDCDSKVKADPFPVAEPKEINDMKHGLAPTMSVETKDLKSAGKVAENADAAHQNFEKKYTKDCQGSPCGEGKK